MAVERVEEVPFIIRRRKRGKIGEYLAIMGYLFQIVRDIDPKLRYLMDTFTLMGLLWATKSSLTFLGTCLNGLRVHLWSRIWTLNLKKKYGEWVVITGATDGIGFEYAKEFARRGHSLILVGRNQTKLNDVKANLSSLISPSRVVTITADFSDSTTELFNGIAEQLKKYEKDIGILVNNAGVMYKSPNRFLDQSEEMVWQHVKVNMAAVLMMTRAVLPGMIQRRRGLIINMSSIAGYRPLPLMGVYSASKKFVEYFSETLKYEYGAYNIDIQTLIPSYIATKMTKWSNVLQSSGFVTPDAQTFAKSAVATIGRSDYTTGYWSHGIQYFFYDWVVPKWLYSLSGWYFLKGIDSTKCEIKRK